METWTTIIVAAIVAFASIFSAFMTNRQNSKRLEKEHERSLVMYHRERQQQVKSEPLLKLRAELARMATKQDMLVSCAHRLHTRFGISEEEAEKQLEKAVDDINTYIASGDFQQTLFTQDDKELLDKVDEIIRDYRESYFDAINYKNLTAEEFKNAMKVFERNKTRIMEAQSLINKRLEEL